MKTLQKYTILLAVIFHALNLQANFNSNNFEQNLRIRPYRSHDDAQTANRIIKENYLPDYILQDPETKTIVYEDENGIEGVCIYNPGKCYIEILAIDTPTQRKGTGRALIYYAIHNLYSHHQCKQINLESTHSAREFYKKIGFEEDMSRYNGFSYTVIPSPTK